MERDAGRSMTAVVPLVQVNALPEVWSGEVMGAIGLALLGLGLVLVLERLARRGE